VAETRAELLAEETAQPKPPGLLRRTWPWLAATAFVATVGVVGWTLGLAVGDLPRQDNAVDTIVSTTAAPTPGVAVFPPIPLSAVPVLDFDPLGKDKQEHPDEVHNAVDGDPNTTWTTQAYKTADFSGVKAGVGLLLDLGRPTVLHTAVVGFSAAGAKVELRVADAKPTTLDDTRVVAANTSGKQLATMTPIAGTKAQWVLVWITSLPKDGKSYRIGVSELRFT
jgi:putative peptidoglycan lipid II flippase